MKKVHLSMINLWCNKNLVDSQLFLWKLLSENSDNIEYYSDPYEKAVELVILNTCSFISSGREEMFQTIEKLLSKKKKVCIIWCGVQYFEKLLKRTSPLPSPIRRGNLKEGKDNLLLIGGGAQRAEEVLQQELQRRVKMLENENISYLSRNDLTLANLQNLTKRSQTFQDFCRYSAPRMLTN